MAPPAKKRPALALAGIVLMAIIAGGLAWWHYGGGPVTEPARPVEKIDSKPAIAVLPFINMSDDRNQEYFSDGMTEDLITDLSRISALTVISRTSTFAFKGKAVDVRNVAKELNVRYVVEGSVRKAGDKVRITAQLIEASTGKHLWANRYDRNVKDIFTLQDEVREKIVSALAVSISPSEKQQLARHITSGPAAYHDSLKGLQQESYFTRQANEEAIRFFKSATELDPSFAAAYAHLAQAYSLTIEHGWTDSPKEFKQLALAAATRGVELDDTLPFAYWSLGRIYSRSYLQDLDRAEWAFKNAIALNPNYTDGMIFLGNTLTFKGRAEEALVLIDKAFKLNPNYPFWFLQSRGMAKFCLGDFKEAVKTFESLVERNIASSWGRRWLIASLGQVGALEDAAWHRSEYSMQDQWATVTEMMNAIPVVDPSCRQQFKDGLLKAGVPDQ